MLLNKRATVSVSFIITVIMIIAGLAILLLVYSQFFSFGQIDREVCHTSVIFRATLPQIAANYIPLKCPTQKICVTGKLFGKGECEEFKNSEGVTTIRVSNSEKGLNQIQKVYADEVLGCWSMMGEGKVDVFPEFVKKNFGTLGKPEPSCIICSRIAVDKESLPKVNINEMELVKYMREYKAPGKDVSYAQYIADEPYSAPIKIESDTEIIVHKIDPATGEIMENGDSNVPINNIDKNDKDTKETAILFAQITGSKGHLEVLANDAKVVGVGFVGSLFLAPIKTFQATKVALSLPGLIAIGTAGIVQQGSVAYNRAVAASYCGDVPTSTSDTTTGSKEGCTVVRTTNYNVDDILQYCSIIESIP